MAHAAVTQEGLVRPRMLVCAKDSHTTTAGGVNALGIPVSEIETAWIYATGSLWFKIPESIKIVCHGTLPKGVVSKDVFLAVIGKYSPSMGQYKSVEWTGELIAQMGMDGRFTLSCHSIELGAKCAPDVYKRQPPDQESGGARLLYGRRRDREETPRDRRYRGV